jgi:hypothetical protein
VATKLLVAATLRSGPAPIGKTMLHSAASGASASLVMATVRAPAALAHVTKAMRSSLFPDCEMARTSLIAQVKPLPVNARDARRRRRYRQTQISLDQMLAESGGMSRAAARARDDHGRGLKPQAPKKLTKWLRQSGLLPLDNLGHSFNLVRHP